MGSKSYTQRTLAWLRQQGLIVDIAERFNTWAGGKHDLFGFIDIVALDLEGGKIIGVQSTGPSGHAEHRRKILAEPRAVAWLRSGGRIWLVSWRKLLVKRGGKARTWQPRKEDIILFDFSGDASAATKLCTFVGESA